MRVTVLLLVAVLSLLVSRCLAVVVRDEQRSTETVKLDFYVMSKSDTRTDATRPHPLLLPQLILSLFFSLSLSRCL